MKGTTREFNNLKASWPAWLALLTLALLYEALPKIFYWGPRGLMFSLVLVLILPTIISDWRKHYRTNRVLVLGVNIITTCFIIISIFRLVKAAFEGQIGPHHLLISTIVLWTANILLFALWYWNLDGGGPRVRELKKKIAVSAFIFPQMQVALTEHLTLPDSIKNWEPGFIDYLFLAFNTSTAFSPTDTPVMSRWAKCMSMIQALLSLTIVMLLAARAINILNPSENYFVS